MKKPVKPRRKLEVIETLDIEDLSESEIITQIQLFTSLYNHLTLEPTFGYSGGITGFEAKAYNYTEEELKVKLKEYEQQLIIYETYKEKLQEAKKKIEEEMSV